MYLENKYITVKHWYNVAGMPGSNIEWMPVIYGLPYPMGPNISVKDVLESYVDGLSDYIYDNDIRDITFLLRCGVNPNHPLVIDSLTSTILNDTHSYHVIDTAVHYGLDINLLLDNLAEDSIIFDYVAGRDFDDFRESSFKVCNMTELERNIDEWTDLAYKDLASCVYYGKYTAVEEYLEFLNPATHTVYGSNILSEAAVSGDKEMVDLILSYYTDNIDVELIEPNYGVITSLFYSNTISDEMYDYIASQYDIIS